MSVHETPAMSADREALVAEVAEVVAWHRLEVEHRAYPAYACACEQWHGAVGDGGGPNDGQHDTTLGHATHVADALADLLAAREQQARAEAWDEGFGRADAIVHQGHPNPCAAIDRGNPYAEEGGR